MNTEYDAILINAIVNLSKHRTQICKVIKQYIYAEHKHHLIGVIYYDAISNVILDDIKELSISYEIKSYV
jgi:hypothetical protein